MSSDLPHRRIVLAVSVPARSPEHAFGKVAAYLRPGAPFGLDFESLDYGALDLVVRLAHAVEDRTAEEQDALAQMTALLAERDGL